MQPAICLLPVVPMRKEPSHRSEMVSQLLFGEYVSLGEENADFVAVRGLFDGYEGWVQANQLMPVKEVMSTGTYIGCAQANIFINGYKKNISIGTPVYQPGEPLRFGSTTVSYQAESDCYWSCEEHKGKLEVNLQNFCAAYLYTPYLWGGKSIFGIDCSGFVQQVFKLVGVQLLRDAWQQAGQGSSVGTLEEAGPGDAAFFQNEAGRIIHVGILLAKNEIVHASGQVRIDTIDKEGILQKETGKSTHNLHSIRRFIP